MLIERGRMCMCVYRRAIYNACVCVCGGAQKSVFVCVGVRVRSCACVCECSLPSAQGQLVTLPCRGPCEVPSAWPLWSPMATGGLLHSTSSPDCDLRKGNLGRRNGGLAPELFTESSTGPAPPTIIHMRTSVCGVCVRGVCGVCV